MTSRTRFLITALFLCHQLPAPAVVTSELHSNSGPEKRFFQQQTSLKTSDRPTATPCSTQAAQRDEFTTICADQQEKDGDLYKLRGNVEIHYRTYVLRADEVTYNSVSGEAVANGHFTIDGGPNDDHIKASHGNYNLTAETGRFYDVTATTGLRFQGNRVILTSTAPFAFNGKRVEKTSSDRYVVYDGSITTCELPHPNWKFDARKIVVDVGGNASIYHSDFLLHGIPIFYFPYATHPVSHEARHSGFLIPTAGRSNTNGNEIGDEFYWAINRSVDATLGAQYLSKRGFSQRGEFRARPSDTSYIDLNFFGVNDRGIEVNTSSGPQILREGGQEARLNAEGNLGGIRAVSNVDYLSSFLFRLAFNDVFTQAVNSEVKSQLFLSKIYKGFSLGGMVERYQNFFQTTNADGTLSNPPAFDSIRILHTPSVDASSVDQQLGRSPFFWSVDGSLAGLSRSEPGFHTSSLLGRFDLNPEISLPMHFFGWSVRPALTLHETYYTERFVNGVALNDPTNRQALETSVEVRPPVLEKIFDRQFLGRKWKHVIEPRVVYRYVTGVNDFANVLHFDERDILSDTHELQYGFVTRLYAKRPPSSIEECDTPMTSLAVGATAPEQTVPWQRTSILQDQPCTPGPDVREVATWEVAQKYFLDPTFGGALLPGQRNVFTTTEDLTGIAFITQPRHLSPLISRFRVATGSHTDTEWDLDYDFQLSRINASTLLFNYNAGPFTVGAGDAFLQIPQTITNPPTASEGFCGASTTTTASQPTCKFQQFRVALGYGSLTKRGLSAASSFGFDAETKQLQFSTAQTTYNWDCCGVTLEYRRYAIANVRNENLFRFTFSLANIGSFGNLRKQERLY
ncbi:MAG TPA: LPS assembly protein LptD [Candidatus Sulfotelmatobacter sp.]|jgi:LPS-assembly protein|nr:LPS assembly protein LptD [Candidatus Sulfotelmatobacter sp.]